MYELVPTVKYKETPWSAIGLLEGNTGIGSGFLIGSQVVVTAAHVLWDQEKGVSRGRQSFQRAYDGLYNNRVPKVHARKNSLARGAAGAAIDDIRSFDRVGAGAWVHPGYLDSGAASCDVGFVVLEEPINLPRYLTLESGVNPGAASRWQIRIPGYPVNLAGGNVRYYHVSGHEEGEASQQIRKVSPNLSLWSYESSGGLSGAPLCRAPSGQEDHVVGIHIRASDGGAYGKMKVALLLVDALRSAILDAKNAALA